MKSYLIHILRFSCFVSLIAHFSFNTLDQQNIRLFGIGDSTMAFYDQEKLNEKYGGENYPLRGWGMALQSYFRAEVKVVNRAVSGRSTKSFISEGRWEKVKKEFQSGDYVLIQFGHNDQKIQDPKRYTRPFIEYVENLALFITEARALGVQPIIATSIARRHFDEENRLIDSHGSYVDACRYVGQKLDVPVIDLTRKTMTLIRGLGFEQSKDLFLHIPPNTFANLPDGLTDNTHVSTEGACEIARLFVEDLRKLDIGLVDYLKPGKVDCVVK